MITYVIRTFKLPMALAPGCGEIYPIKRNRGQSGKIFSSIGLHMFRVFLGVDFLCIYR